MKMRGTPQQVRHPPPLLGQHTDEALSEFGFDRARQDALRASGAFDR
jgi:crotonobetainyl-CoA:carnitine CoA-transferase CaiB-like acyl-CoA transferase